MNGFVLLLKLRGATRSITVWGNSVLLAALPVYEAVKDQVPGLAPYVSDSVYKWMGLVIVILNIAVRFRTSSALEDK